MTFDKEAASQRTRALLGGEICKPSSLGEFIESADDSYRRDVAIPAIFGAHWVNVMMTIFPDFLEHPVRDAEAEELEIEILKCTLLIIALWREQKKDMPHERRQAVIDAFAAEAHYRNTFITEPWKDRNVTLSE